MALRVLGDYTIIKQLGNGSLGSVYLAEHRFMKKQFALKVLPEELACDRAFIQRFEDEVKLLSKLDHPSIVKIHNVSSANGLYFLVTDCIVDSAGESLNLLHHIKDKGQLKEEEIIECLRQIADALDYVRLKSTIDTEFVHRGIKLNNILVDKSNGSVKYFLSDFGLSKIVGISHVLSRTYKILADALGINPVIEGFDTQSERYSTQLADNKKLSLLHSSFLQGFAFLSPEQKMINTVVTQASDTFAFGTLAYYLLTGILPEGVFDLPSEISSDLKYNWDSLILSCLQFNPEKRPLHLVDFLNATLDVELKKPKLEELIDSVSIHLEDEVKELVEVNSINYLEKAAQEKSQTKSVAERIQERIRSEYSVTHYRPEINESKLIEPIQTDVVVIPGGTYNRGSIQGSRDEMPAHSIKLAPFAIDIHPVTNEMFVRYLEYLGDEKDPQNHDVIRLRESRIRRSAGKLVIESGYAKHPVIGVSWYGALGYAKWVGKRLPTEAEWEIAAKGGFEEAIYPSGDDIEKFQANFFSSDTTATMSYSPNGYGLYDMAGNVYEWCQDWYDYNYYEHSAQEPSEPKGPLQGVYRVLRGGCWKSLKEDLRVSHRHRNNPGTINRTYGFRCASDI